MGLAEAILTEFDSPVTAGDVSLVLGANLGVAHYPDHAPTAELLLQRADAATYRARQEGSGIEVYAAETDPYAPRRLALAADLSDALERDEVDVYVQPKVSLERRPRRRRRGARALDAPEARPAVARPVHPGGRAHRRHPPAHQLRRAGRPGPVPDVARRRPRPRHLREPVRPQPLRHPPRRGHRRGHRGGRRAGLGAHARAHRVDRHGREPSLDGGAPRPAGSSACGSRSTTSAPATRRWRTCAASRSPS